MIRELPAVGGGQHALAPLGERVSPRPELGVERAVEFQEAARQIALRAEVGRGAVHP